MLKHLAKGLLGGIPVILLATFTLFVGLELAPGDPAAMLAGPDAPPDVIEATRQRLNLDDPLIVRYLDWLGGVVQGDLGESLVNGQDVSPLVWARLQVTLSLVLLALLATVVLSTVLGTIAALRPRGVLDRAITGFC